MDTKRRTVKAELKPYQLGRRLGSGVMVRFDNDQYNHTLVGIDSELINIISPFGDSGSASIKSCKPILRPKEHLTIPITHNGETFVPIEEFEKIFKVSKYWYAWNELIRDAHAGKMDYRVIQWLIAHNFHIDEPLGTWISVDELETNPYEN